VSSPPPDSRLARLQRKRERTRRRWRNVAISVASATLAAMLAAGLDAVISHVIDGAHERLTSSSAREHVPVAVKHSARHSPGEGKSRSRSPYDNSQSPLCPALKISESPLDSWIIVPWTFPAGFIPSPGLIAEVDSAGDHASLVDQALYDAGGYAPFVMIQAVVQNPCQSAVTITNVKVSKSCSRPNNGSIFYGGPADTADAGLAGNAGLGFDLDSPDPEAMVATDWNVADWQTEYDGGPVATIPAHGVQAFVLRAIALHSACEFSIVWTAVTSTTYRSETLDDDGQPFRVSALLPAAIGKTGKHPFAGYQFLYVGGQASPWHDESWTRENPASWP
jgi:hypothetical protein